jgi:hypothetical protein
MYIRSARGSARGRLVAPPRGRAPASLGENGLAPICFACQGVNCRGTVWRGMVTDRVRAAAFASLVEATTDYAKSMILLRYLTTRDGGVPLFSSWHTSRTSRDGSKGKTPS